MKKVLIIDDDKHITRLVAKYLNVSEFLTDEYYTGENAVEHIRSVNPDLLLLDVGLPVQDGWKIIQELRVDPSLKTLPVIMLTARVEDTDKIIGLELGADDYITKPFNAREVVARVKAVLRRSGNDEAEKIIQIGALQIFPESREIVVGKTHLELTSSEFDILHLLAENPNFSFTREEILQKCLGYDYEGFGRTLDTHIKNIRKKLQPFKNMPEIKTVYKVGYKLVLGED
ncbi:MAG: response regulator transcription factor [Spirochaetales bacterium]|nr:response regulator transcription factor [Spirochaetales bacterium]